MALLSWAFNVSSLGGSTISGKSADNGTSKARGFLNWNEINKYDVLLCPRWLKWVSNWSMLKDSLHIILMTIVFLEINQLHSIWYRLMITKENNINS